ncbi:hypothetical protein LCGC14_3086860 [marine sediment metagenome]|uniref:Uncharacterized protein n=1 Tax=marine sediment metagenome TaxID=412755 RepID=A0A0F8WCB5_9ZZZZ
MEDVGQPVANELDRSREAYANGYYQKKLAQGQELEDFVGVVLYKCGIVTMPFASKLFQQTRGENMLGAEIKNDERFRETGNLYIETAEKSHPNNPNYTPSGIQREDNTWLYVIGDRSCLWIFSKTMLKGLARSYNYENKETPTSLGFLLPLADADKYAAKKIEPSELH